MKSKCLSFGTLLLALVLTACSLGAPGTDEQPAGEPEQQIIEEYPVPDNPPPVVDPSESLYPGFQDGDEINWIQATAMIVNGEVVQVVQTHDLKVSLTLRDGRTLVTYEPEIDAVLQVIEGCGDLCSEIVVATE